MKEGAENMACKHNGGNIFCASCDMDVINFSNAIDAINTRWHSWKTTGVLFMITLDEIFARMSDPNEMPEVHQFIKEHGPGMIKDHISFLIRTYINEQ